MKRALKAHVKGGRLLLDEPTDLSNGEEAELVPLDEVLAGGGSVKVELSDDAKAEVARIDAWWRQNRPATQDLFLDELDVALVALEDAPTIGTLYEPKPGVRRLLPSSSHPPIGKTIYQTTEIKPEAFGELFADRPWVYGGKK